MTGCVPGQGLLKLPGGPGAGVRLFPTGAPLPSHRCRPGWLWSSSLNDTALISKGRMGVTVSSRGARRRPAGGAPQEVGGPGPSAEATGEAPTGPGCVHRTRGVALWSITMDHAEPGLVGLPDFEPHDPPRRPRRGGTREELARTARAGSSIVDAAAVDEAARVGANGTTIGSGTDSFVEDPSRQDAGARRAARAVGRPGWPIWPADGSEARPRARHLASQS